MTKFISKLRNQVVCTETTKLCACTTCNLSSSLKVNFSLDWTVFLIHALQENEELKKNKKQSWCFFEVPDLCFIYLEDCFIIFPSGLKPKTLTCYYDIVKLTFNSVSSMQGKPLSLRNLKLRLFIIYIAVSSTFTKRNPPTKINAVNTNNTLL